MGSTSGDFGGPNGPKQCTAISKRSRERCKGPAVAGSRTQKCRMHGGINVQIGGNSVELKHGRHSKYLPKGLDELYQNAVHNPELLDMSENIALMEARINGILSDLQTEGVVPRWSDIREVFGNLEVALLSGKADESIAAMEKMHMLLDAGKKWDTSWGQIGDAMESLRKLTDTEVKRKKELNQMIPVERVVALMAAVGNAVKRHVTDPDEISAVFYELAKLHGAAPDSVIDVTRGVPVRAITNGSNDADDEMTEDAEG